MADADLMEQSAYERSRTVGPSIPDSEAVEVARLLMRAGVDHASALWFQLLELATQQACDWTERAADSRSPLPARAAALLGLRSLAADLLSTTSEQDEGAYAAAEACLAVCDDPQPAATAPAPRRWGEGATPSPPQRPNLLDRAVGCC